MTVRRAAAMVVYAAGVSTLVALTGSVTLWATTTMNSPPRVATATVLTVAVLTLLGCEVSRRGVTR